MPELIALSAHCQTEAGKWHGEPMQAFLLSLAELFRSHAYGDAVKAQRLAQSIVAQPLRVN